MRHAGTNIINTVLLLYNTDDEVHRADHVIAKPPYNEDAFNIELMEKVLQLEPKGSTRNCTRYKIPNLINSDMYITSKFVE